MQRARHQKIKGQKTIKNRTMDKENNFRAFVDLDVRGNAKGGTHFILLSALKDFIKEIELKGVNKVVGFVYDETDKFEILTQPVEDLKKLDIIEGIKPNGKVS